MADYDIYGAFEAIENELIASMIRNMERHKAEEEAEGFQWSMWQAEQLKYLEEYKKKNQKKHSKKFAEINKNIGKAIREAHESGNMEQELEILRAIQKGFTGFKRQASTLEGAFFELNERKLETLIKATTDDMKKAETAILRMANDQYRKAIFNAQVYANTGAGTYEKAVDMATHDMLASGLNCVEYSNGSRHKLKDYADMALRTASKRAYLAGEGEKRQEWGIATVIVNKRGNPCPKCLPFCGKVLIDDVWSGGSRKDGDYPLMSTAVAAGLYHPRCKDSHTTYFPGISTADDTWTKAELKAIEKYNQQEAKRQYAERQIEKFRRLERYSLDEDDQKYYGTKAEEWEEHRESISQSIRRMLHPELSRQLEDFNSHVASIPNKNVKDLLQQAYKRTKFKVSKNRRSYFSKEQHTAYIAKNAPGSSVAHELFHEIDYMYGISESGVLTKAIVNDFGRINNYAESYGISIEDLLYSKYPHLIMINVRGKKEIVPAGRGISDILHGMSDGKVDLGYGHRREGYWSGVLAVEKETWAQYGRMYFEGNREILEILNELFPETTREIEQTLKGMIK